MTRSVNLTICAAMLFGMFFVNIAPGQKSERKRTRQEYATALARIKLGMTPKEVTLILGPPDDVRYKSPQLWGYGVRKHREFAVYGEVSFDKKGRVVSITGGTGKPPSPKLIDEKKLQQLLRLIDKTPEFAIKYNPGIVIQVANSLHPLGKKKALRVIEEYQRVAPDTASAREGLYGVLFSLFEVPKKTGYMPEVVEGVPYPLEPLPKKRRIVPRYPLCLEGDVPLLLIAGYFGTGEGPDVSLHIEYFQKHGVFRRSPLKPTDKPLDLLKKILSKPTWYSKTEEGVRGAEEGYRDLLIEQLLRLTTPVFPEAKLKDDSLVDFGRRWRLIRKKYRDVKIRWDSAKGAYIRVAKEARKKK